MAGSAQKDECILAQSLQLHAQQIRMAALIEMQDSFGDIGRLHTGAVYHQDTHATTMAGRPVILVPNGIGIYDPGSESGTQIITGGSL
jgi:hypothetical protein